MTEPPTIDRPLAMRMRVIAIARTQVGQDDPSAYWLDVLGSVPQKGIHWCGAFVLWTLRTVLAVDWKWVPGLGFIYCDSDGNRLAIPRLPVVASPRVGDVAYYDKPFQHYALVESALVCERVALIAGNMPEVRQYEQPLAKASAYYSIAPIL